MLKSIGVTPKFRNFLGNFPVHYAALFIKRTVNNNYMTLLMAFHHTHDGFWYFLRVDKNNTLSWHSSNFESANKKPSFIRVASCVFRDVVLVSDYHSYKEKTIKLLLYHGFYGDHISPRKSEPPFLAVRLNKYKPPGSLFSSIPLKDLKLNLSWSLQHFTLNTCAYYFFFAEYKLITCRGGYRISKKLVKISK